MEQTFDTIPETEDAVHLLIVGDSKTGKSIMTAQAAIDGFYVIYIDGDNGASALRYALKPYPEAKKRVQYFPVEKMSSFLMALLRSGGKNGTFYWVPRLEREWGSTIMGITDNDVIWCFDIRKLPKSTILAVDSWSVVAADALDIGTADASAKLLDGTNQQIYGEANINLTYICNIIQKAPFHVIVQAHGVTYEKYDKPLNVTAGEAKQKDMKLREIKDVPLSSSRPHGETMASRFNHIGWLYVNAVGQTEIDFTRAPNRIGGGPPNKRSKIDDLPFSKLVSPGIQHVEPGADWFYKSTHIEVKARRGMSGINLAPPSKPTSGTAEIAPSLTLPKAGPLPPINLSGAITARK